MSSQEEAKINVNHKDTLFQLVFGKEENKRNLLELYNAITGSDYDNLDDLTINTLEKAIYMNMKNDVSCIIDARMALFEPTPICHCADSSTLLLSITVT